ncbi:hypothetical protein B0A52_02904 [Exophiala mesophila]|uniref:Uncharacterized protein n=1 Tax=Exophiala mesophila TaxID=212818 RepID=A0A438NDZ8_EXOME|nr:hypothetical protein B0A52_02904 [Exophiala mesophila]
MYTNSTTRTNGEGRAESTQKSLLPTHAARKKERDVYFLQAYRHRRPQLTQGPCLADAKGAFTRAPTPINAFISAIKEEEEEEEEEADKLLT